MNRINKGTLAKVSGLSATYVISYDIPEDYTGPIPVKIWGNPRDETAWYSPSEVRVIKLKPGEIEKYSGERGVMEYE